MKKLPFAFFLYLVLFAGCYERNAEPMDIDEALVIPPDKMELVMTDLFLVEGAISLLKNEGDEADNLSKKYFMTVLDNYGVTREQFEESLKYYTYHIEELDKIFEEVIVNLSKLESEVISEAEGDTVSNEGNKAN